MPTMHGSKDDGTPITDAMVEAMTAASSSSKASPAAMRSPRRPAGRMLGDGGAAARGGGDAEFVDRAGERFGPQGLAGAATGEQPAGRVVGGGAHVGPFAALLLDEGYLSLAERRWFHRRGRDPFAEPFTARAHLPEQAGVRSASSRPPGGGLGPRS